MPRAGLNPTLVVTEGAALADEIGFADLTMGALAERVGVRTPSLYKHVDGQAELSRRIATLALDQAADAIGAAVQGRAGRDALSAAAHALRDFVLAHPGRYAATIGLAPHGPDDPLAVAEAKMLRPFEAVLRGYGVVPSELTPALRALRSAFHGFATLQAGGGFQWADDVDASFEWLIDLLDRGLRERRPGRQPGGATSSARLRRRAR